MISQPRILTLSEDISAAIAHALKDLGIDINDAKKIAECVLKTSDFYIQNPQESTPWKETWCQIAQAAYFFPLNYLRNQAVMDEALDVGFPLHEKSLLDFGSGLGAGSMPYLKHFKQAAHYIERSNSAHKIHRHLLSAITKSETPKENWHLDTFHLEKINPQTVIFSYSLTELEKIPSWAMRADSLIILEPATRDDGRKLLALRQSLIEQGFYIWAPCPHQHECPLLKNSKSDWCHDRIHLEMPDWFLEIENNLPIKNKTLTFSYLLASKQKPPIKDEWRLTGDQLEEKGKTKQMICRSDEREFLTWLHRFGNPTEMFRYQKVGHSLMLPSESNPHPPRIEKR
jgi:ribosomal protein RSM22 (predicted rRNA methylase)